MSDNKILINEALRVLDNEIEALIAGKNRISDNFAEAATMIAQSNKVIVSGVGKSGIIAKKISATLSSIGVSSIFIHPVESLHGDLGIIQNGDVAILLSKSGSTEEIVRLVPYIRMRNAKIIAIVGNMNSFLGAAADITIDAAVETEACPFNLAPTSSTTLALALGDALAVCCMKIRHTSLEDFSRLHPLGQIGKNVSLTVRDLMTRGAAVPVINPHANFRDAIIEISEKKLGCVCVVDSEMRLLGLLTDGDIRRTLQKFDDIRNLSVAELMTGNPVTVNPNAYIGEALAIMENRTSEISMLPVVADNKLTGILHIHQILQSAK